MASLAKTAGLLLGSNLFMTAAWYGHQEAITFLVFGAFAWLWLGELPQLRYGISAVLIIAAVAIAFA
jgi:uncharacterized protein (DUF486 family)